MESDSDESTKDYAELTPLMLETSGGESTEVKVPYSTSELPSTNTESNNRVTFETCNTDDSAGCTVSENYCHDDRVVNAGIKTENDDYSDANGEDDDDGSEEFAVYLGLQTLYRGLPKEMFVNKILADAASCEIKLGETRSALFEQLKEAEDFPYGLQAMLKRRVYTRSGDSVSIKLAHDIHTLMSVIEGAEYSDMRELLSSGSGRSQRSQSCSSTANETINCPDVTPEIKVLTESVNSLKADMLKMKQSHLAVETTRSKQIDTLKSTVLGLKADITTLSNVVCKAVTDIKLSAERIESEKSLGVTNLKSEMRLMKGSLASIEDSVFNLQTQVASGKTTVSYSGKTNRKDKSCHKSGNLGQSVISLSAGTSATDSDSSKRRNINSETLIGTNLDRSFTAELIGQVPEQQQSGSSGEHSPALPNEPGGETDIVTHRTADVEGHPNQPGSENVRSHHGFRSEMNMHNTVHTPNVLEHDSGLSSYRDVVSSTGSSSNFQNDTGQSISTRITRNAGCDNSCGNYERPEDDEDDFEQFVKKKAKRFYLGGFKPSITRQRIENYVNKRGPTVTWVRIWNSKRRPNNVIIRINVEDNDRAKLLESERFWPRGVTCRPWVNGGKSNKARKNGDDGSLSNSGQLSRHIYGRSDIDYYNPFSPLRTIVTT